jgi:phosphopantothenoylcysteine synthetase/decarboxylase
VTTPPDGDRRAPSVPSFTHEDNGVTYMIVSAGGNAVYTAERAQQEIDLGRRVRIVPTPQAAEWLDYDELEALTGWRPEHKMRPPRQPTFSSPGCRVLASPVTLNTLTKWAHGHADNFALSLLCEAAGLGIEVRAEISLSKAYAAHPAAGDSLATLRDMGVRLMGLRGTAMHSLLSNSSRV